ncbi:MAG TPA: PfkB family carbohydrate kinase [Solirubrobacteraceae bacterium]|nr:PfkB family carbohydrate kinase [Solirubrobacteraceae bacterium]
MNVALHYDYTTVGHVTIDVLEGGSRQAGGAAFYSALQAARLGLRTQIVTRGVEREIEDVLAPYHAELHLSIQPARHTTTLHTSGSGSERVQRVLAWAGPIRPELAVDTNILHLAPVARESPASWRGSATFVGLTPQGLVREWGGLREPMRGRGKPRGPIQIAAPTGAAKRLAMLVAQQCDAIVVSEHERASCAALIEGASAAGALVAVTAGEQPTTIIQARRRGEVQVQVPAVELPRDDLGAGDVFAAAFFVSLSRGRDALDAARFANAAAAVRVSGMGAQVIGGLAEIQARVRAVAGAGRERGHAEAR